MHCMIIGQTMSGKTTLARKMISEYIKRKREPLVCDPIGSSGWDGCEMHNNVAAVIESAKQSRQRPIFVDEFGLCDPKEAQILATTIRHWGHRTHFIGQRYIMMPPNIRNQCAYLYSFQISKKDSEEMAVEFVDDAFLNCVSLQAGEYVAKKRHGNLVKRRIF